MCGKTRVVNCLSTIHVARASSPVTVQRREKDGSLRNVECPPLLPDYQALLYERDRLRRDQLMGYYNVGRRSKKKSGGNVCLHTFWKCLS